MTITAPFSDTSVLVYHSSLFSIAGIQTDIRSNINHEQMYGVLQLSYEFFQKKRGYCESYYFPLNWGILSWRWTCFPYVVGIFPGWSDLRDIQIAIPNVIWSYNSLTFVTEEAIVAFKFILERKSHKVKFVFFFFILRNDDHYRCDEDWHFEGPRAILTLTG